MSSAIADIDGARGNSLAPAAARASPAVARPRKSTSCSVKESKPSVNFGSEGKGVVSFR